MHGFKRFLMSLSSEVVVNGVVISMIVAFLLASAGPTIAFLSVFGTQFGALSALGVAMPCHPVRSYFTNSFTDDKALLIDRTIPYINSSNFNSHKPFSPFSVH
jgi:hypothetical protein